MKILMLLCLLTLIQFSVTAQNTATSINDFCGSWKGRLEWNRPGKPMQHFTMRLNIQKTDSAHTYTWQIMYGDEGKDIRPYLLKLVDSAQNHWVIDENNGIVLDNYLLSNCLTGSFTVMGNTITDSYCLENGKLKVVFTSMKLSDKKTTGKGTEDAPSVDSYRITGLQQGWLEKQRD
jgi:hypothetical protein